MTSPLLSRARGQGGTGAAARDMFRIIRMNQPVIRLSSSLSREYRPEGTVYVKRYLEGDWDRTARVVQARIEREVRLLGELAVSSRFGGSLGVVEVVEADPEQALLVTREVVGQTLDITLAARLRWRRRRECYRALYLAGKWLRRFQSVPIGSRDQQPISRYDPCDLVEYCEFRIDKIRENGYPWPSDAVRARLLDALRRLVQRVSREEKQLIWTHGDYAPGNIVWDGRVLTPIDFGMAHGDWPLADVTYFIHRLEMMRIYRPWLPWPIGVWKRAFLRGYGSDDAEQTSAYQALRVRHLLCRVLTYVRHPPRNLRQSLHNRWIRWAARTRLERICRS